MYFYSVKCLLYANKFVVSIFEFTARRTDAPRLPYGTLCPLLERLQSSDPKLKLYPEPLFGLRTGARRTA